MRCHSVGCGMTRRINAIDYAKHRSRSHDAVLRVYDVAGNVIEKVSSRGLGHFIIAPAFVQLTI